MPPNRDCSPNNSNACHYGRRTSVRHCASPVSHSQDSRKKLKQRRCLLMALQTAPTTLRIMCDDSCTLPVSATMAFAPLTLAQSSAACGDVVISGAKAQCQVENDGGTCTRRLPTRWWRQLASTASGDYDSCLSDNIEKRAITSQSVN
jgi:hypothetical protein